MSSCPSECKAIIESLEKKYAEKISILVYCFVGLLALITVLSVITSFIYYYYYRNHKPADDMNIERLSTHNCSETNSKVNDI